ncbi:MAG TPA: DUF177 domain-containing protein [Candidatus Methanoperedens sp.]|nr:DUF177 domain-containing protein [Candidatus Methanoperedens sp.]
MPPEGLELSFEIEEPARAGIALGVPVDGPIRADFDVRRLGNELRVDGSVRAAIRLECSRCLTAFVLPVDAEVGVTFAPRGEAAEGEHQHELSADELEIEPLVQGGADLRGVIAEQIHLALPLKPLCSQDCRGICPRCGKDVAAGPCGCAPAGGDPRWEALKKLTVP